MDLGTTHTAVNLREDISALGTVRSRAELAWTAIPVEHGGTQMVWLLVDIWPRRRPAEDLSTWGGHHRANAGACRPLSLSDKRHQHCDHARLVRRPTGGAGSYGPRPTVRRLVPWDLGSAGCRRGFGPSDLGTISSPGPPDQRSLHI